MEKTKDLLSQETVDAPYPMALPQWCGAEHRDLFSFLSLDTRIAFVKEGHKLSPLKS
jgi:hypothetical protein